MTNTEAKILLNDVYRQLMSTHPMPEGSDVDSRLAMTIGLCAGAICEGLDAERAGRHLQLDDRASYITRNLLAVVDVVLKQDNLPGGARALLSGAAENTRRAIDQ